MRRERLVGVMRLYEETPTWDRRPLTPRRTHDTES